MKVYIDIGAHREELVMTNHIISLFRVHLTECRNPVIDLKRRNIIESFIEFMAQNGKSKNDLKKEFEDSKINFSIDSFDDYIYEFILGLKHDISFVYVQYEADFKKTKEVLEKKSVEFRNKQSESTDKIEEDKYKYLINEIQKSLTALEEKMDSKKIISEILLRESIPYSMTSFCTSELSFATIEAYRPIIDWHLYVIFGHLPAGSIGHVKKIKQEKPEKYLDFYQEYIEEYNITENLISSLENTQLLQDRLEIFQTGIELFNERKYQSFVYLMAAQVEGLIHIYLTVNDIDDRSANGLKYRTDLLKADQTFLEYVHFAYDFRRIRNHIEHGEMIDVDCEMAMDILMDLSWLIEKIKKSLTR